MRVIAGAARRTLLVTPAGENTRPTADRAKESLFNILGEKVRGAAFLDIFCGSGAIGIEALSRGAKEAAFIENSPAALKAVKENLAKTKLTPRAEIFAQGAEETILHLEKQNRRFDFIFLDPPYESPIFSTLAAAHRILAEGGTVIAETDAKSASPCGLSELILTDTRVYGRTKFLFFREV